MDTSKRELPALKRPLDSREKYYRSNPSGMADYHWSTINESMNPYPLGSIEGLEYTARFQKLSMQESFSP